MSQISQKIGTKSRGGLGSKETQRNLTNVIKLRTDPHPLVDRVGEEVTQKHLNKLILAQLILKPVKIREHISGKGLMTREVLKYFMLYFFTNKRVKWMDMDTLLQNKHSEELAYVKLLLEKRAEVTNKRNRILRAWLDRISTKIREEYKLRKGGPHMLKLKCSTTRGEDEEIEIKILKVFKDHRGPYVMYKYKDWKFHDVSINKMLDLRYKPNDLRALHYRISCATLEMIELKKKVTIALNKGEKFLLEEFMKNNSKF